MKSAFILGRVLLAMALLMVPFFASAAPMMDSIINEYQSASVQWANVARAASLQLFGSLALIELSVWAAKKLISGEADGFSMVAGLMWKIIIWGFFMWMMNASQDVITAIINSFSRLGQLGSGLAGLTPSSLIDQGMTTAAKIAGAQSFFDAITNPFASFVGGLSILALILAHVIMAGHMFMVQIEVNILIAAAPVMLAGGALSFTREWAVNILKGAVALGVKTFVIYLIAGVAMKVAPMLADKIAAASLVDFILLAEVFGAAALFILLAVKIPGIASMLLSGTPSLSANDGIAMAAGAVAGGAAVATAGAAALGGAGAAAIGGGKAIHAGMQVAAETGAKGFGMVAQGLGHAGAAMAKDIAGSISGGVKEAMASKVDQTSGARAAKELLGSLGGGMVPTEFDGGGGGTGSAAPASGADSGGSAPAGGSSSGSGTTASSNSAGSSSPSAAPTGNASNAGISGSGRQVPPADLRKQTLSQAIKSSTQEVRDWLPDEGQHQTASIDTRVHE